ncbi:uncharacterized protein LOC103872196 [Brassica rapa]|uniref:uncharacterized protein LOC103872196 n=1 Tax=Brassica campestris TaxID=3711 RepID=UPI0004F1492D|nr:uncharacterized protein LOC103872196 [Brassica rapa]XP_048590912.1 uncharacterized protein LOC125575829 [Brassica napus]
MAMLSRLPTRDQLASWGIDVPLQCVLCSLDQESHQHLFFGCPFVVAVWARFTGHVIPSPPTTLQAVAGILSHYQVASSVSLQGVSKLLLQCIIYCIWRKKNFRIFQQTSTSEAGVIARADRLMCDRLISLPPSSAATHSPPQVCF